ncbi:MAG TPA: cytochrome c peroxidase [Stellaceae bacterium]|jgi:cytochrome c peroxidase
MPIPRSALGSIIIAAATLGAAAAASTTTHAQQQAAPAATPPMPHLPLGVSPELYNLSVPAGRRPTPEQAALGERLFMDPRLSVDGSVSCSTCHDPAKGFIDHKVTSEGVQARRGTRNSPTVLNAMFQASMFWDGRAATLEDQAKLPILNPVEMAQKSPDDVVAKVRAVPEYVDAFTKINGREPTYDDIAAAIAAFERTQFSGNAPFDRFITGDDGAIDDAAKRGWALFNGKGRCNSCHNGNSVNPLFSDQKFHNIGIAAHKQDFAELARKGLTVIRSGDEKQIDELALQTEFTELGRFLVTKKQNDVGAFKTETLRNIGITAPYMHDGSLPTLWDVMDHYNKGGIPNPYLDGGMQRLGLTESEIDDVVAFLFTLTDDRFAAFNKQELARQAALKATDRPQRDIEVVEGKKGDLGDVAPNPDLKNPAHLGVY